MTWRGLLPDTHDPATCPAAELAMTPVQILANAGELAAFLMDDRGTAERFATWYNHQTARLGMAKEPTDPDQVQIMAHVMLHQAAQLVGIIGGGQP